MNYCIYSIEDDEDIRRILNVSLKHEGYDVVSFPDGASFFEAFSRKKPNMILLDMMLPDMSGTEILKEIRSHIENDEIEILIVSANHMITDKIDGLSLGADDYIEKPFDLMELFSRIKSKKRRFENKQKIQYGAFLLDKNKHFILFHNNELELTNKEYQILELLIERKGDLVTKDDILDKIWGENIVLETRTIDTHLKNIRKKLQEKNGEYIQTVYGIGFRLKE